MPNIGTRHRSSSCPLPHLVLTAAGPGDAEALVAPRIEAMLESLARIGRFDPARARERFLAGLSPAHTRHVEIDGERVGVVLSRPQAGFLLLNHPCMRPTHRGRGRGSAVLGHVVEEARALRLPVRVGVPRGSDANRFYIRHGFCEVEQGEHDHYCIRPFPQP